MVSDFRLLLWNIKQQFFVYKNRHQIDAKTGISDFERRRISSLERYSSGSSSLFSKPFLFSRNTSFLHSLDEVFGEEVYRFETNKEHPLIIDCGANIGLSVLYFRRLFPQAKIIAFEPDTEIFEMLSKNLSTMDNNELIELHNEAVWTEDTILKFERDGGLAGKLVHENNINSVSVKAIDFKKYLNQKIDFLKIDIEGAENTLIFDIQEHLSNVKLLFLEYHGFTEHEQNLGDILNLLKNKGFYYYIRVAGENKVYPFLKYEEENIFDIQLNIFCTRI